MHWSVDRLYFSCELNALDFHVLNNFGCLPEHSEYDKLHLVSNPVNYIDIFVLT